MSIDHWSAVYGVDPRLARATAWMESGFQQGVVSNVGAVGVMQLLPNTWSWVDQVLLGTTTPRTYDGNVRAGVRYLRWLLDQFGGDSRLALAGYYQGARAVRDRGLFDDTKRYVSIILKLYGTRLAARAPRRPVLLVQGGAGPGTHESGQDFVLIQHKRLGAALGAGRRTRRRHDLTRGAVTITAQSRDVSAATLERCASRRDCIRSSSRSSGVSTTVTFRSPSSGVRSTGFAWEIGLAVAGLSQRAHGREGGARAPSRTARGASDRTRGVVPVGSEPLSDHRPSRGRVPPPVAPA